MMDDFKEKICDLTGMNSLAVPLVKSLNKHDTFVQQQLLWATLILLNSFLYREKGLFPYSFHPNPEEDVEDDSGKAAVQLPLNFRIILKLQTNALLLLL